MHEVGSLVALLATVTAISLTGVMAPGPVTAVTVTKGAGRKEAGALVALGHGIVELPMIVLIWLGFATVMSAPGMKAAVGIAGGAMLLWMGIGMLRTNPESFQERRDVASGCVLAGLTTTVANPYWFVWWATVGAALVASAGAWGILGIAAFAVTHWLCDVGWLSFLSWGVFTSRRFWTPRVHRTMLAVCGIALLGFGVYFLASGTGALVR
jgi:threonine/homoserine/homoserine lactone efflux protein